MLHVNNISFRYSDGNSFKGIRGVSLKLERGEVLALVGKSGSGKTTILKCIYGLEDLQSGEISVEGETVTGPAYNLIPGHRKMQLVSQDFYVLDNHTVEENLLDKLPGLNNDQKNKRVGTLLRLLELEKLKTIRARNLSSGQRQRVAIGRALAIIPPVLLLDEPFNNLDKALSNKLFSYIIREVKRLRTSAILVTHLPEEALKYADKTAVVHEGKISQEGSTMTVYYRPVNTRLAGLLGDFNILRPVDMDQNSKTKIRKAVLIRPDKLLVSSKATADITMVIRDCVFNGKCFELFCETKSGKTITVYSCNALKKGITYPFLLSIA